MTLESLREDDLPVASDTLRLGFDVDNHMGNDRNLDSTGIIAILRQAVHDETVIRLSSRWSSYVERTIKSIA